MKLIIKVTFHSLITLRKFLKLSQNSHIVLNEMAIFLTQVTSDHGLIKRKKRDQMQKLSTILNSITLA